MSNPDGYIGTLGGERTSSEYNALSYVINAILSGRAHVALVQVLTVTPGTPQSLGTVDVQPMVNQLDADGAPLPHGSINNVPWFTLQAGPNAVLLQPEVGDRGLCVFADRDISSVKTTRAIGNPGSLRQDDMADALYLGGFLNDDPTQWIKMDAAGIVMHSPIKIRLEAPTIEFVADDLIAMSAPTITIDTEMMTANASSGVTFTTPSFDIVGAATVSGLASLNGGFAALARSGGGASTIASDVQITGNTATTGNLVNNGKDVGSAHAHGGVQTGGGTSGPPV